tara:strand:+ start:871 stop:1140 length:270 start_codon:yes stop_codon:yes gene_type:complete
MYIIISAAIGTIFGSVAAIPHVLSTCRGGSTKDFNTLTMLSRSVACISWSYYAYITNQYLLLIANMICIVFENTLLIFKLKENTTIVPI